MHRDSRGYWYKSKRDGGRVTREYLGRGEWQAMAAALDEADRQQQIRERAANKAARDALDAQDGEMQAAYDQTEAIMRQVLHAAGYRQHKRGEWRKQRGENQSD